MTRQELQHHLKQLRIEGYVTEGFKLNAKTEELQAEYDRANALKVAHHEHLRTITKECKDNYEARQQVVVDGVEEANEVYLNEVHDHRPTTVTQLKTWQTLEGETNDNFAIAGACTLATTKNPWNGQEIVKEDILEEATDYDLPLHTEVGTYRKPRVALNSTLTHIKDTVNTATDILSKVANYTYMLVTHENTIRIATTLQKVLTIVLGYIWSGIGFALAPSTRRTIDSKLTEVLLTFCDLVDALEKPVEVMGKLYYQLTHRALNTLYWVIVPDVGQPDTSFLSPPRS